MKTILMVFALVLGVCITTALAQNPDPTSALILSEVFYDVEAADDSLEWVELYNRGSTPIDLSNYSLGNGGSDYTYTVVQLSGTVPPHTFFVVGGPTSDSTNYYPSFDQAVDFNPDFQNSGSVADGVALFNVPAAQVGSSTVPIDVVIYGNTNSNGLINTTGDSGSVDVDDAPPGSSIERTSVSPNTWHIQSTPTPGSSAYKSSLPVELISFTALASRNSVQLRWTTATETNNIGFEIQRSNDRLHFEKIGFIEGHGSSAVAKGYSFTDHNLVPGVYYYRLKQLESDGAFRFSPIIKLEVDFPQSYSLHQNYPNPFNPSTTITFDLKERGRVVLRIYNQLGQEITTLVDADLEAGFHKVQFHAKRIPAGIYFYKLSVKGFERMRKMILLR